MKKCKKNKLSDSDRERKLEKKWMCKWSRANVHVPRTQLTDAWLSIAGTAFFQNTLAQVRLLRW